MVRNDAWWSRIGRPAWLGLSIAGPLLTLGLYVAAGFTPGFDFYAYWSVNPLQPYVSPEGLGAFHYAPPLAWAGPLFAWIPWPLAYWVWFAIMIACLWYVARRWTLAWLAFPPVALELYHGNIHLLIAAALVARVWWFLPLAKITTAVGLVWPGLRHERAGLGIFAGLCLVSYIAVPTAWPAWFDHLRIAVQTVTPNQVPIPLVVRLPLAILLIAWGARSGRWWTLPVGLTLALPVLWFHGAAVLVAATRQPK